MGMESSDGQEEKRRDLQKDNEIMKVSRDTYPADDPKAYEEIVNQIIDTYDLTNPVDQMIANRAATQLMMLQHCQKVLAKYGLFYKRKGEDGVVRLEMNQLSYFMKQLESEFRANIRMLRGKEIKSGDTGPGNFSEWIEGGGKNVKTKRK